MSTETVIVVTRDTANPAIDALVARMTPQRLSAVVGPECEDLTRRHIAGLGKNKRGWPSTGFYEKAADATMWEPHPEGALVRVCKLGMRQRFHGGPISPVHKGALAIAISPVSYGRSPSEFPGLFLIKTPKGAYLVQYGENVEPRTSNVEPRTGKKRNELGGKGARRRSATLNFLFKLSSGVDQEADPDVLPTHAELRAASFAAIQRDFRRN